MTTSKTPKVSVIMPVYNREKLVSESIKSVLNQTYKDFEFLICDDGSKDETWNVLDKYASLDSRIKLFKNEKNLGISKTLNKLISYAKGEYLARQDSDDLWVKNKLKIQVEFLDKNLDYGIICSDVSFFGFNSFKATIYRRLFWFAYGSLKDELDFSSSIAHATVVIRKSAIEHLPVEQLYRSEYDFAEDYELWCRLKDHIKFFMIRKRLVKFRLHDESTSVLNIEKQRSIIRSTVCKNLKKLGVILNCEEIPVLLASPHIEFDITKEKFESFVCENKKVILRHKHLKERVVLAFLFQACLFHLIAGKRTMEVIGFVDIFRSLNLYRVLGMILIFRRIVLTFIMDVTKFILLLGMSNTRYNEDR